MRGDEAKKVCPNIQLIQVPVARGKADLNLYRNAGSEVCVEMDDCSLIDLKILTDSSSLCIFLSGGFSPKKCCASVLQVVSILATKGRCERASIDEVYLDLTDAAESMLLETPDLLEEIDEEVLKSHVLGVANVRYCQIDF